MMLEAHTIRYIVKGEPIASASSRPTNRRNWDAQKQHKIAAKVDLTNQHEDKALFAGPIALELRFFFSPTGQQSKRKLSSETVYHCNKPDLGRLIRFVEDVCIGTLYDDDCIIASLQAAKSYDEEPRTEILIKKL